MAEIFLSYASPDRPRAKVLAETIAQQGWSVWWDRKIPYGKSFDEVIEKNLGEAKCVIVLWTKDSISSKWVRTEASEAAQRGTLIPVLLDLGLKIPLEFKLMQAANLSDWKPGLPHSEFQQLVEQIAVVLGQPMSAGTAHPEAVSPPMGVEQAGGAGTEQSGRMTRERLQSERDEQMRRSERQEADARSQEERAESATRRRNGAERAAKQDAEPWKPAAPPRSKKSVVIVAVVFVAISLAVGLLRKSAKQELPQAAAPVPTSEPGAAPSPVSAAPSSPEHAAADVRGMAAGGADFKYEDSPQNLKALFELVHHYVHVKKDSKRAATLFRSLIPDETRLKKALKDSVAPDTFRQILERYEKPGSSGDEWVSNVVHPAQTVVQVDRATTEEILRGEGSGFPGGAKRVAEQVLRPGVTFYEVKYLEPGENAGMQYHLLYWDGNQWSMLGALWRVIGKSEMQKLPSGLQYEDVKIGTGAQPKTGQTCVMHYTGWLWEGGAKGAKFNSSVDRGQPFEFQIGQGMVIKGWDEGVASMKVGGKRALLVPPGLGYGARGAGKVIPPNATLLFEVELLGIK